MAEKEHEHLVIHVCEGEAHTESMKHSHEDGAEEHHHGPEDWDDAETDMWEE